MLDGFRADYATREDPSTVPTLTRFEREGVMAKYVQPIYPALSMPSWTTIVTGMAYGNIMSSCITFRIGQSSLGVTSV